MGARRLILLRHGAAESPDAWPEDFERPLTRRGTAEVTEMATRLQRRELFPELIVASPAERTWSTAKIVAEICEIDQQHVQCARELYLATAEGIWQLVRQQRSSALCLLVCGHNPAISELASRMGVKPQRRQLPTAGYITVVWHAGTWDTLQPRAAVGVELDDPETPAEL